MSKARAYCSKSGGVPNVDEEYNDLVEASAAANSVASPFRNISQRRNRPQLAMACFIPFFQQVTGINAIMFYAPVLFQTIGFKDDASLYSAVITGAVNVVGTFVSIATVDRYGRRKLFLQGGIQMFLSQVIHLSTTSCSEVSPLRDHHLCLNMELVENAVVFLTRWPLASFWRSSLEAARVFPRGWPFASCF